MIAIVNSGKEITETNYWDTEFAKRGFFYLSWNAGALRLLVPENQEDQVQEMLTGKICIVSRGMLDTNKWSGRSRGKIDSLELMFDDGSNNPFALHVEMQMSDRAIVDDGKDFVVAIWTRSGKKGEMPGRYRVVKKLPCLKAWV